MITDNLQILENEVWKYVETLRDNPTARLNSREAFYKKYGRENQTEKYGFGDSEIAFLGWEERSVLRPPEAHPPGSEWWSNVNLWFIFLSELGAKAFEVGFPVSKLPTPAAFWVVFIKKPDPTNWYKAHNSSIIDGYLKYSLLAEMETVPEKIFLNKVLYRLLYAQSMVEGQFIFPKLGKILGDPRGMAVRFITSLDAYYPSHYPMTNEEIDDVLGKVDSLSDFGVKFFDDVLIEPELKPLYKRASVRNKQTDLNTLIVDGKPAYPGLIALPATHKGRLIKLLIWIRKFFMKKQ